MMNTMKTPRVAALHDLSGFGRCALTVIIPTLSALGVQVVPLPTALLSTHTGGFTDIFFLDLTEEMKKTAAHWKSLGLTFDAIYTGFLGSPAQAAVAGDFIASFCGEDTIVLVDPVMGDDGVLYSTYNDELMRAMGGLCLSADIITPNLTEACFLTDTPFADTAVMSDSQRDAFLRSLVCALRDKLNAHRIAVTGVPAQSGSDSLMLTFGLDSNGDFFTCPQKRLPEGYPGTGDIFASVLLGKMLAGAPFRAAAGVASAFTHNVIEYSLRFNTPHREGVHLEPCLQQLMQNNR